MMLDLRFVKEHRDEVVQNIADRFMNVDADKAIALYDERNRLIGETEELRKQRNDNAKKMKGKLEPDARSGLIEEGKSLK